MSKCQTNDPNYALTFWKIIMSILLILCSHVYSVTNYSFSFKAETPENHNDHLECHF